MSHWSLRPLPSSWCYGSEGLRDAPLLETATIHRPDPAKIEETKNRQDTWVLLAVQASREREDTAERRDKLPTAPALHRALLYGALDCASK